MIDDTPAEMSIESTVLGAIDAAARAQQQPIIKAGTDAHRAKWFSYIALAGLCTSLVAVGGVGKALHDSKAATANYRRDTCARGNDYRAGDLQRWTFLLNLASKPDPSEPKRTPAQKKQDAAQLAAFRGFLSKVDAPIDCAALARAPK